MQNLPTDISYLITAYSVRSSHVLSPWVKRTFGITKKEIMGNPKYSAKISYNPLGLDLIALYNKLSIFELVTFLEPRAIDLLLEYPEIQYVFKIIPKLLERHDASRIINRMYKTNPKKFINYMIDNILDHTYFTSGSCEDLIAQQVDIYDNKTSLDMSSNQSTKVLKLFAKSFDASIWDIRTISNLSKNPNPFAISLLKKNWDECINNDNLMVLVTGLLENPSKPASKLLKIFFLKIPLYTLLQGLPTGLIFQSKLNFVLDFIRTEFEKKSQFIKVHSYISYLATNENPRAIKLLIDICENLDKKYISYSQTLASNPGAIELIKENPKIFNPKICPKVLTNPAIFTTYPTNKLCKLVSNILFNL